MGRDLSACRFGRYRVRAHCEPKYHHKDARNLAELLLEFGEQQKGVKYADDDNSDPNYVYGLLGNLIHEAEKAAGLVESDDENDCCELEIRWAELVARATKLGVTGLSTEDRIRGVFFRRWVMEDQGTVIDACVRDSVPGISYSARFKSLAEISADFQGSEGCDQARFVIARS